MISETGDALRLRIGETEGFERAGGMEIRGIRSRADDRAGNKGEWLPCEIEGAVFIADLAKGGTPRDGFLILSIRNRPISSIPNNQHPNS